ncbi:MAG: hypothetical protein AUJ75_03595 [Candidatus Omnitrophica bacterium CG1_02_49_10]|nr:MAG: hypothetical protein AUJ75_03595 [Candidatus Omnitrophica bacterium CG1_02_49_10]
MKIRIFKEGDVNVIKELVTATMEHEIGLNQEVYPVDDFEDMARTYGEDNGVFFVAEENGRIVGGIGLTKESDDVGLVRRFFVDAASRRKGIGSLLMENITDFSKNGGYKRIEFRATGRMIPAISLCVKNGFLEKEKLSLFGVEIARLSKDLIENESEEKVCQKR